MYRILLVLIFMISTLSAQVDSPQLSQEDIQSLYNEIGLEEYLSFDLFELSFKGYKKLLKEARIKDDSKLTIIDFSRSSNEERFFVVDLKKRKLLYASLVAHGKNSGGLYAEKFSNTNGSLQSSLGFYVTAKTYYGKHGYSLRLKGQEVGFNCRAEERAVVMHGAQYVSEDFIKKYGRLGRSWGCPALPKNLSKEVIDKIKNGSCLFVYSDNDTYLNSSSLLNNG